IVRSPVNLSSRSSGRGDMPVGHGMVSIIRRRCGERTFRRHLLARDHPSVDPPSRIAPQSCLDADYSSGRMDQFPTTTTTTQNPFEIPATMNPSIDRIVFQIEQLGGVINELSYGLNVAVGELGARAQETVANIQDELTGNKTGVPDMLNTVSVKFSNWPVSSFLIVCITGLILIIVGLIFLCSKGVAYWAERRYKRFIPSHPSDIENL
ncbi:hypothetical protein PFISCL1PPCAC_2537, partial [Pristionchus fissidentatus]